MLKKQYIPMAFMALMMITNSSCNAQGGYKKNENGLEYKIVKDVPGTKKPGLGDVMTFHLKLHYGDSVIFDSRKMNNNEPVPYQLNPPAFKGDVAEGFMMLTAGDSASFRVSADSMKKYGMQLPPYVALGKNNKIQFDMQVVTVKTQAEVQTEMKAAAAAQGGKDDKIITDYLAAHNIKATKTASGLYYKIDKPGTGPKAAAGQNVTMEYTGTTIDGTKFDSNVDPQFQHVQPFTFMLGAHQVIAGWDEGIALMNKGAKGTLYIPSPMAYGAQSPSPAIKPNSVLIFDVEVKEIADAGANKK